MQAFFLSAYFSLFYFLSCAVLFNTSFYQSIILDRWNIYEAIIVSTYCTYTVEPVYNGHPRDWTKLVVIHR